MSAGPKADDVPPEDGATPSRKSPNSAPDAVKDPNAKTDGKPGLPPGAEQGDETDPGGG